MIFFGSLLTQVIAIIRRSSPLSSFLRLFFRLLQVSYVNEGSLLEVWQLKITLLKSLGEESRIMCLNQMIFEGSSIVTGGGHFFRAEGVERFKGRTGLSPKTIYLLEVFLEKTHVILWWSPQISKTIYVNYLRLINILYHLIFINTYGMSMYFLVETLFRVFQS